MGGQYNRKDHLYRQAKAEGYRSRAAYKLIELDQKYRFLRPGSVVVDLGCFPGGWLQVAAEKVGAKGRVVGVDLREVEPIIAPEPKSVRAVPAGESVGKTENRQTPSGPAPVEILLGDVTESSVQEEVKRRAERGINVVLSDMSPQLSGIRFRDVARSAELVETAFVFAENVLQDGGTTIAKAFPGPEVDEVFKKFQKSYNRLSRINLKSSRNSSDEIYFVGQGFRRKAKSESTN